MWNTKQIKKSMDDHNHFHTVLMVVDGSIGVWGKNILCLWTTLPLTRNTHHLYRKLTAKAWCPAWELDMARWCNNVTYSPSESELATLGVTSTDNYCDDCGGVTSSSKEDEEGDECDPEQVVRTIMFTNLLNPYIHNELVNVTTCNYCVWNVRYWMKEMTIFGGRGHLFIIFVGLGTKWTPFIFFFFVSMHFWHSQCSYCNCHFPKFIMSSQSLQKWWKYLIQSLSI